MSCSAGDRVSSRAEPLCCPPVAGCIHEPGFVVLLGFDPGFWPRLGFSLPSHLRWTATPPKRDPRQEEGLHSFTSLTVLMHYSFSC